MDLRLRYRDINSRSINAMTRKPKAAVKIALFLMSVSPFLAIAAMENQVDNATQMLNDTFSSGLLTRTWFLFSSSKLCIFIALILFISLFINRTSNGALILLVSLSTWSLMTAGVICLKFIMILLPMNDTNILYRFNIHNL